MHRWILAGLLVATLHWTACSSSSPGGATDTAPDIANTDAQLDASDGPSDGQPDVQPDGQPDTADTDAREPDAAPDIADTGDGGDVTECDADEACSGDLYCGPDDHCHEGLEDDPCGLDAECASTGRYCGPDDRCHDGSTGDPCEATEDCQSAVDTCQGDPAVCTAPPCGNGTCAEDESWNLCPADCEDVCGDGVCDPSEQLVSPGAGTFCAEDCQVTVIFELDATGHPPGESEGAWIAGNQAQLGDWTPNTVALRDDGLGPDLAAGDLVFTAAFVFDPGTSLRYKYTIGAMGAGWDGTEEYPAGNNRGYTVPTNGIHVLRLHDVWAEQPATPDGMGASSTVSIEDAACVFDGGCDRLRENDVRCPSECPGPDGTVYVPPGVFPMGSPPGELGRGDAEVLHDVTLTRGFLMDETEVTQGDWQALMGNNPSSFSDCGDDCPVERVTWSEALAYANARSEAEGLIPCYTLSCSGTLGEDFSCGAVTINAPGGNLYDCEGYRLPTEAEWEYAYRAGTTTAFYDGPITQTGCDPLDPNLDAIGWYCGNADDQTHPVAQKLPNARGLYDMSGNVWEWCWDRVGDYAGDATDPTGTGSGGTRAGRGGAWNLEAQQARGDDRNWYTGPDARLDFRGLRLVRTAPSFCSREGGCQPVVEGGLCSGDADCPAGTYCASAEGRCRNGSTGDACDATADCANPNDLCDTTCRAREDGEACGPGATCPGALYCGPDDGCHAGAQGDPCNTTDDCLDAGDLCDSVCRGRADGEACGPGGACGTGLYCDGDDLCALPTVCTDGCPFTSIQAAIDAASEGDTITLGPETFTESDITVSVPVTLVGFGPADTVVQAAASADEATARVFHVPAGVAAEIDGVTVQHGNAEASPGGGGVFNEGTLTLRRCVVFDNRAGDGMFGGNGGSGGGILSTGDLTVEECTIRDNQAGNGSPDESFGGGSGGLGGGIRIDGGTLTLARSTVVANVAGRGADGCDSSDGTAAGGLGGEGGGMALESATALVQNSTFSNNASGPGGGAIEPTCTGGTPLDGNGGGILSARSDLDIVHSTVTGNATSGAYGGGGVSIFFGSTRVRNSVIAENSSANANADCFLYGGSPATSGGHNLLQVPDGCGFISAANGDLTGVAPELGPLGANGGPTDTRLPVAEGNLVDAVPTASCVDFDGAAVTVDQRGVTRPAGPACDIGAVELEVF